MIGRLLLVSLGGAVGTAARYIIAVATVHLGAASFIATLSVNAIGSFLLALLFEVSARTAIVGPTARIVLVAGVLGGFTTYSSFNQETLVMLRAGSWALAVANVLLTVCGCLAAGVAGLAVGRALTS